MVGTSALGDETVAIINIVEVLGNVGTLGEPRANVWGLVNDSQTANYSNVDTTQTPNYSSVNTTQTPNYEEVA